MNFKKFQELGYDLTDQEIKIFENKIVEVYKKTITELQAAIDKSYTVLAGISPENAGFYNEMLKHGRLEKLYIEITAKYKTLFKDLEKIISQSSSAAITNNYYRQLYSKSWLADELKFVLIPESIVELSVYGSADAWKNITKSIEERFGKSQYKASYGTLSELLQKHKVAQLSEIQTLIANGLQRGLTGKQMADSIKQLLGTATNKEVSGYIANAMRIIRTESNRAMNDGAYASQMAAADQGINIKKIWIATLDGGTRPIHGQLDGQTQEIDKPFKSDGFEVMRPGQFGIASQDINCLLGNTSIISPSKLKTLFKRYYEGVIYNIVLSNGVQLSITPKHPILTFNGWDVPERLNTGDKICCIANKRKMFFSTKPKINNIPTVFSEVFNFFNIGFSSKRVSGMQEQFHGDGVTDSDVNVIFVKSKLLCDIKSFIFKKIKKFFFTISDILKRLLFNYCSFNKLAFRTFNISNCIVSLFAKIKSFFRSKLRHSKKHCFASVVLNITKFFKSSTNSYSGYSKHIRKFFNRNSGNVQFVDIVKIDVSNFNGHVYNLHNVNNYYYANSAKKVNNNFAVVHNCRCTTGDIIDDQLPTARRGRNPITGENEVFNYKTFDTWAAENGLAYNKSNRLVKI